MLMLYYKGVFKQGAFLFRAANTPKNQGEKSHEKTN